MSGTRLVQQKGAAGWTNTTVFRLSNTSKIGA
jgi:hypothetical protein